MTVTPAPANSASMAATEPLKIDGAAGVAEDEGGQAEAAGVERGVADAVVVSEAGEEDAVEAALAE